MSTSTQKPAHGTAEWAVHNLNIQQGCGNDCRYCYAKAMAIRFGRMTSKSWATKPKIDQHQVAGRFGKRSGRIMFPTSHDIDPSNIEACLTVLKKVLAAGNEVLIVTKPVPECIKRLCAELGVFKDQVMFRFTIGSANNQVLRAWEPGAPSFEERLASLKHAFAAGYQTSLSCEPMLDQNIHAVIDAVRPYVTDKVWLGRANQLGPIIAVNCPGDRKARAMAEELKALISDDHIRALYARYGTDPLIRWKDSAKKVLGLDRPTVKGLDV